MTSPISIMPYDVFFANKPSDFPGSQQHYYVCVYAQTLDMNNVLVGDVYGLLVTSNEKFKRIVESSTNDYIVDIEINGKPCYVCCDKLTRIKTDENVELKRHKLSDIDIAKVKEKFGKFLRELNRQFALGGKGNDVNGIR